MAKRHFKRIVLKLSGEALAGDQGFGIGKLTGMSWKQMVAVSIEVGMQNSGLATGLAKVHFASMPLAGVPGAVFSAWHNISGAVLAYVYSNYLNKRFDSHYGEDA